MASLRRVEVRITDTPLYLHIHLLVEKGCIIWTPSIEEDSCRHHAQRPDFMMHDSTFSPKLRVLAFEAYPHALQYNLVHLSGIAFVPLPGHAGSLLAGFPPSKVRRRTHPFEHRGVDLQI